jgi:hypothetical protein
LPLAWPFFPALNLNLNLLALTKEDKKRLRASCKTRRCFASRSLAEECQA